MGLSTAFPAESRRYELTAFTPRNRFPNFQIPLTLTFCRKRGVFALGTSTLRTFGPVVSPWRVGVVLLSFDSRVTFPCEVPQTFTLITGYFLLSLRVPSARDSRIVFTSGYRRALTTRLVGRAYSSWMSLAFVFTILPAGVPDFRLAGYSNLV
jgi:hypothetical protein